MDVEAQVYLERLHHRATTLYSIAARSHAALLRDKLGDCPGGLAEFEPLMPQALEHMAYPSAVLGNMLRRRVKICDFTTPEAVEWGERNLQLYLEALGERHASTAGVFVELSQAQLAAGQLEAALASVNRAIEILAKIDPDDKIHTKQRATAVAVRRRIETKLAEQK